MMYPEFEFIADRWSNGGRKAMRRIDNDPRLK